MSVIVRSAVDSHSNITKRAVLKQIALAFDLLGLFSPVILHGKVILQTLWNQNISWDEALTSQDIRQWYDIHKDF